MLRDLALPQPAFPVVQYFVVQGSNDTTNEQYLRLVLVHLPRYLPVHSNLAPFRVIINLLF
jgi:hypothetical protein